MTTTSSTSADATTLLVDTSLLIQQQKREKYAAPVRKALAPYSFKGASSYSKLEFKRAWLQRFAYLHETSRRSDITSINDLIDHINRTLASHPYQKRRLQTCLDMLIKFFDLNNGRISSRAQLSKLQAHCRRCALDSSAALAQLVTHFFTGTRCVRAEEPVTQQPDGSLDASIPRCKPAHAACAIRNFFTQHRTLFIQIANHVDALSAPSAELQAIRDNIRLALTSPEHLCSSSNCSKIADAIIAIDGANMAVFAANNDAEWRPIASALGKPLLNPVQHSTPDATVPDPGV